MRDEADKITRVVGLQYEPGEGLPQVIVKGSGQLANEMIEKARKLSSGPQIVKDEALLQQLYRLPMEAEIGSELFQLVAILLAHVFSIEEKLGNESNG